MMAPMLVTIDRAGRVVVPKEVRHVLGIEADSELELTVEGDGIRLSPRRRHRSVTVSSDGWPLIEAGDRAITDSDVQRWRDADQR